MLSSNAPQTIGVSSKPTLRTADLATQHEYTQVVDAQIPNGSESIFHVDPASWRQMVSWAWADMLRDADTTPTCGGDLKPRQMVVAAGTRTLYKLRYPVASGTLFGRHYTLWDVVSINTPRQAQGFECFYSDTQYRVLPSDSEAG